MNEVLHVVVWWRKRKLLSLVVVIFLFFTRTIIENIFVAFELKMPRMEVPWIEEQPFLGFSAVIC